MKRKKCDGLSHSQTQNCFALCEICGTWESLCGSPGIKIYHDGRRFRLQFIYRYNTAFTVPLSQCRGIPFFNFYGIIYIAYDEERDILWLTDEGNYKRVYNEV